MYFSKLFAAAAAVTAVSAGGNILGFNYDANVDFQTEFTRAKALAAQKFTSARLYTMIAPGTTNTPIGAIQAAINTKTTLLLGLWASEDQAAFDNEITALKTAISQYGTAFTSLIDGISVGSEDLYRISPTGIENNSGAGAGPAQLVSYIKQVRAAIKGTSASAAPVGHVDVADSWTNATNKAVITNSDWLGMDEYPYYETTTDNTIANANTSFYNNLNKVKAVAGGKRIFITETGWPVTGATSGKAVASTANARIYWQDVACSLIAAGHNTWWYIMQDPGANPSFGVLPQDNLQATPLYSLKC